MKIYMDNCCFNRPFDDQSSLVVQLETEAKLDIQDRVKQSEIALLRREPFDYTEWRQGLFVDVPLEQFLQDAQNFRDSMAEQ